MTYQLIEFSVDAGVATIALNRPDRRNAMSDDMRSEFANALQAVTSDKAVRALVLTGRGSAFCAGGDVSGMKRRLEAPQGEIAFNGWSRQQGVHWVQSLLLNLPKPTIAAVNGAAAGLGADTALACDFLIGSERSKFTWSYIKRGLIPDGGGSYFLPRRVGIPKAKELIFTGRMVEGQKRPSRSAFSIARWPLANSCRPRRHGLSSSRGDRRPRWHWARRSSTRLSSVRLTRSSILAARRKPSATPAPSTAKR